MNSPLAPQLFQAYPFLDSENFSLQPFGEGLIHQTLILEVLEKKWILQGFNESVFRYPERIDHNLNLLFQESQKKKLHFQLPLPILNQAGSGLTEIDGKKYRLFEFVQGKTLQQIENPYQAFLASQAYGAFAAWAKEIPSEEMQETIPDFHRLDLRYAKLIQVAGEKDSLSSEEKEILDFYVNQKPLVDWYLGQLDQLPQRITHNDTKINNLIFSDTLDRVEALIDLDTLMGGFLLYDFGDLVRTVACSLPETSTQWDSIHLIPEIFKELLSGYWSGVKDFATEKETASLILGGEIMTLIMGLRFFTDHLQGNIYYRGSYPEQNLHRAKNQMIFLKNQQDQRPELRRIWSHIIQQA
ncbi:phosphotransferase enzyme family protein [Algoriphagus mannitolivorans]|uniref:phosphotransferase enzyme family protein n=1 Tax=Algoriphagus mannitolivorans TaxID=226504 RepID=UPI00040AF2F0|nr:aminoglycoside phosphotransferase family protein [Algoriphagus mannitolivorans]